MTLCRFLSSDVTMTIVNSTNERTSWDFCMKWMGHAWRLTDQLNYHSFLMIIPAFYWRLIVRHNCQPVHLFKIGPCQMTCTCLGLILKSKFQGWLGMLHREINLFALIIIIFYLDFINKLAHDQKWRCNKIEIMTTSSVLFSNSYMKLNLNNLSTLRLRVSHLAQLTRYV